MALVEALQDGIFSGLTDAECVTKFDEIVEISRDNTPHTLSTLNNELIDSGVSVEVVMTWDQLVSGVVGSSILMRMLDGSGVDFSLDSVRAGISAAIASTEDQDIKTFLGLLLQVGIKTGPLWKKYGLLEAPTEGEVAAARIVIQNRIAAAALLNECINPLTAQGKSLEEIKSAVAAWGE